MLPKDFNILLLLLLCIVVQYMFPDGSHETTAEDV